LTPAPDIIGIILAGGLSRRMFPVARDGACADLHGGDKGLLALGGKSMLAHVIERLRPQVGAIALNANGDPARFAEFGLPVVADTIEGFVGPLAGVLAGILWARQHAPAARWVATVSADAPFVPADLVARLRAAVEARGNAIAIAQSGGELHPVIGLWPVCLAEDLDAALRGGLRKVLAWTDKHGTVSVAFEHLDIAGTKIDPFFNANTPDELAEARRLMAQMGNA
jgi:molybdopterin-guanine dinucleotide biosynthesis protein A